MAVYGDLANAPAVPLLLAPAAGLQLARPLGSGSAPAALRIAYAGALVHRGRLAAAQAIVDSLPDSADVDDLRGQLFELRSDPADALTAYARAHDFERAQRLIDDRDAAGELPAAAHLEAHLVEVLAGERDAGIKARALWRFGQITQEEGAASRDPHVSARRSLQLYEAALQIAPNEETYLLAAGRQALTVGDKPAALRYYRRALDAVPASVDARRGLLQAGR